MCGIVGYVGEKRATNFLVEGLSKLEYRGYDSAGVAVQEGESLSVRKHKGRLTNLEKELEKNSLEGCVGIGHTRWATHGAPSDTNSHPHLSNNGRIAVVHNGIIENYIELRKFLGEKGYKFLSETDTEVIPNLVDYYYEGNLFDAVVKATEKLEGSFAIGVISEEDKDTLIGVRKDSPLIVGLGENENFIASDIPAVLSYTRKVYLLEDEEFVLMNKEGVTLLDKKGNKIEKEIFNVTWDEKAAEKGGFDSFMLKEIHEQPKAIRDTMTSRISMEHGVFFDDFKISKEELESIDRIYIVACGTAYHAGLMGKASIERLAKIPVEVDIASEFRYRNPLVTEKSLVIILSQSGETADTLAALRDCKNVGARVLVVTNVVGSTMSREADHVIYTMAGPEISVASTKAYTTQVLVMHMIAIYFSELRELSSKEELDNIKKEMLMLPEVIEEVLNIKEDVKAIAEEIKDEKDLYFLGRGMDFFLALEGSLKLKEISYIHSEAYAGGELKHGPIALIEEGTKVVSILTQKNLIDKMISNVVEIKSRGAKVFGVTFKDMAKACQVLDKVLFIPETHEILAPIVAAVTMQLLAYYVASLKGFDIDKPRNLAKSVTVE
ncbi:glutamine--fructose-6-phosphate transaminase (isomerizing) [Clostridium thermobutyricum]|uniref:Glutamine--fructose-6-phosphate aminotransferase [isomerizing] n=1 Tax=Clostridium thermobutyricum DSM 4928 TaxID=1121339 RepID=A0A1V4SU58_9CLOT|nr:glutamine--fructose-6-phosphate transaminase (isomerizing) [Clostridium thermobutyricum]OPX46821.1 glutamine--fructose-6-phosphate aminotransferase [Clostridium thermobutyricum DSM 4928]